MVTVDIFNPAEHEGRRNALSSSQFSAAKIFVTMRLMSAAEDEEVRDQ
jgi:hypothetical protein